MSFMQMNKRLRLGLALLASGAAFFLSGPLAAQTGFNAPYREDPGSALSRHLKTLADSPRNLSALTGAAKAALELGDPQAAVTFFARAEEISPRDGRIKAGIGSAFVAMEQPQPALRFFEEARGLGAPEGEYAADRGLAYDLLGDPVQAQRDYQLAMRTQDGDELRRRLALSRAISGDQAGALAAIDAQLRRQDRAAWRVRAFVLALTGDANGATEATRSVMPHQAAAMQPFFARLPSLRPAERALAVHFGRFPGDGAPASNITPQSYASLGAARAPAIADAGRPSAVQPGFGRVTPPASAPPLASGSLPRGGVSRPAQTRPVQTAPSTQVVRTMSVPTASPRSEPNALQRRWDGARGISRAQTARAETRPPVAEPQTPVATAARIRGTGSLAQDRVSGIYTRAEPTSVARPAGQTPVQASPTQVASRQQVASLSVRPPLAGVTASTSAVAPTVANQLSSANTSPLVAAGAVQGPPSPSGMAPAVSAPVQAAPPVAAPAIAAAVTASPGGAAPQTLAPAPSGSTSAPPSIDGIGSVSLPPSSLAGTGAPLASTPMTTSTAMAVSPTSIATATPPVGTALSAGLADVAATIRALPSVEPEAPKTASSAPKVEPVAKPAEKTEPTKATAPSRHWVQIAGAADKASLGGEYARLKGKAPKLFADKSAWTTPLRYTNRLLVGPFDSENQAQSFVNELAKSELSAFSWTSPAGQSIEKLAGK